MVKGDSDVLSAVRNLKQQTVRKQNLALDDAADVVMATLDRITPVDTSRLLGNVAKSKPRSKKVSARLILGMPASPDQELQVGVRTLWIQEQLNSVHRIFVSVLRHRQ